MPFHVRAGARTKKTANGQFVGLETLTMIALRSDGGARRQEL